jgi:hypothetical protein
MLDFTRVRSREKTIAQLAAGLTIADLHKLTDEMVDTLLGLIAGASDADVVFQPVDAAAKDTFAATDVEVNMPWTLGHVIVHATASAEEAAALSSQLARGVPVSARSRYEVPWQTATAARQLHRRLEESRRMRHAFLNAWPDEPHLELTFLASYPGATEVNAVGRYVQGLSHDDAHIGQIREIMRQAREARGVAKAV